MKKIALLLIMALASTSIQAKTIFHCTIEDSDKVVYVTQQNGMYHYQFGRPGKPELIFQNKVSEALKRSPVWEGIGRYYWRALVLKNGQYFYTLRMSSDRFREEGIEYSIEVSRSQNGNYDDDTHLASLTCDPIYSKIIEDLPEGS